MFTSSMETMDYQINSKLGSSLDSLWQEVIDYRDTKLQNETKDARIKKLHEYFGNTIPKKFFDIVWKYAGLWVERMEFKSDFQTCFATLMFVGECGAGQIADMVTAGLEHKNASKKPITAEELVKIAKSFNSKTGGIRTSERVKMRKYVTCLMYFDFAEAFCLKDYVPDNANVEYLSAREITAIILHEIGHTLTLVDHAADMFSHIVEFDDIHKQFFDTASTEEILKYVEAVADSASSDKVEQAAALRDTAKRMRDDIASDSNADINKDKKYASPLFTLANSLAKCIWYGAENFFDNPLYNNYMKDSQVTKYGDVISNSRNMTWMEREADVYAIKHGYGAEIIHGFQKTNRFDEVCGCSAAMIDQINRANKARKMLSLFNRVRLSCYVPSLTRNKGFNLYPLFSDRYREAMRSTIAGLKKNSADPAYVLKYMDDIESILKDIEEYDSTKGYLERCILSYKCFLKYVSIQSFADIFVHGRVMPELDKLINQLEVLNNNLITFYGEKLKQLARS